TVMHAVNTRPVPTSPAYAEADEAPSGAPVRRKPATDAQTRAEYELLRQLVLVPRLRAEARELLAIDDALTDVANVRLAAAIVDAGEARGGALYEAVRTAEPELADELSEWLVDDIDPERVVTSFRETLSRLKEFALRRQILRLQARMSALDAVKDSEASDDIFRQVAALRRELETLRSGS
ncbi:MAG TPA: hypothetical protein VF902_09915, partial [Coriobacteriia bacterium]